MKAIVVDDEKLAGDYLLKKLTDVVPPIEDAMFFMNPMDALKYAKSNTVDLAFLDIEMFEMTGIELAKRLKDINHEMKIIFVTGFSKYAVDAFAIHANGYLLKPASKDAIQREIDNISQTWENYHKQKLVAHTFGNFYLAVDDVPLKFHRAKAKELLAYLIDRNGAFVTSGELIAVLWEDKQPNASIKKQYQTVVSDMMATLKEANVQNIVIKGRNQIAVKPSLISCDYYDFLGGNINAINSYMGEYMTNYSWAEFTTAQLTDKING